MRARAAVPPAQPDGFEPPSGSSRCRRRSSCATGSSSATTASAASTREVVVLRRPRPARIGGLPARTRWTCRRSSAGSCRSAMSACRCSRSTPIVLYAPASPGQRVGVVARPDPARAARLSSHDKVTLVLGRSRARSRAEPSGAPIARTDARQRRSEPSASFSWATVAAPVAVVRTAAVVSQTAGRRSCGRARDDGSSSRWWRAAQVARSRHGK